MKLGTTQRGIGVGISTDWVAHQGQAFHPSPAGRDDAHVLLTSQGLRILHASLLCAISTVEFLLRHVCSLEILQQAMRLVRLEKNKLYASLFYRQHTRHSGRISYGISAAVKLKLAHIIILLSPGF